MPAVREFTLPDLGEGLTEAEIIRWLVAPGDVVETDQPVVEVETAKAAVEVPCPYAGVVTAVHGEPGSVVAVGTPLVGVAVADEGAYGAGRADAASAGEGPGDGPALLVGSGGSAPPARRRRRRAAVPEPVPDPAPTSAPEPAPSGTGPVAVISPLVRRIARERGIDLRALRGSGPDGLIVRADVERASAPAPAAASDGTRVPLRGAARAAAEKFSRAHREIPAVTVWVETDATELLALRDRLNAHPDRGPRIGLLSLLARICTAALARHPELNASVDAERGEIVRHDAVNLGVAAQTDQGLRVPVLHGAHELSTARLAERLAELTDQARTGSLPPTAFTGGTFTLNNYGVFGVDGSTPLLNHPEAGMLGIGRIVRKPWEHDGGLALRHITTLTATFDHRVCDGAVAGRFLRFAADCVEDPAELVRWG